MTVVVGYIPNQFGEAALEAGIAEAQRRGVSLVVVNTTKGDSLIDKRFVSGTQLSDLNARLAGLDIDHDVRQSVGTDVADELLTAADEVDADVVVIGIRHRTPVGKMLMGSVAQRVLMDATCAVLSVKPPREPEGNAKTRRSP